MSRMCGASAISSAGAGPAPALLGTAMNAIKATTVHPSIVRGEPKGGGWGGGGVGGGGGAEEGQVVGLVGRRPVSRRRKRASSCLHQPVVLRVANKAAAAVLLPVSRVVCTDNGAPWLVDAPRAGAQAAAAAGTAAVHSCNGALPRISTDGRLGAAAGRWLQERERERRAAVYFSCPHNVQRRRLRPLLLASTTRSRRGKTTAYETPRCWLATVAAAGAPAAGQHEKNSSHRHWSHTKELATSWHGRPLY
jgi:hypothetical protein